MREAVDTGTFKTVPEAKAWAEEEGIDAEIVRERLIKAADEAAKAAKVQAVKERFAHDR